MWKIKITKPKDDTSGELLVVKKVEDSLGQMEPCHSLEVGPLSGHTLAGKSKYQV